ncbi:hypothetical protein RF55_17566 [Lasius niger]|uniref:Uncharacterized protein n=1 Tax=Lasius niger TaxID=67767 RepID=A0A0J7MVN8_LASNI|nr:hypothetical protein RF55_17566 [Lasius niger]
MKAAIQTGCSASRSKEIAVFYVKVIDLKICFRKSFEKVLFTRPVCCNMLVLCNARIREGVGTEAQPNNQDISAMRFLKDVYQFFRREMIGRRPVWNDKEVCLFKIRLCGFSVQF